MKYEMKEINNLLNEVDNKDYKRETKFEGGKLIPVICTKKEVSLKLQKATRYLNNHLKLSICRKECQ